MEETTTQTKILEPAVLAAAKELGEPPAQLPDQPPEVRKRKTRFTTAELLSTEFPEPNWAIPGLLPEGLDILGGRPKIGKSWLLMQIAHAVGTGGRFFDKPVKAGNVLYIAFEDSPRRIKNRALTQGIPHDANINWRFDWGPFQGVGMGDLLIEINRQKIGTIIIDTLTRGLPGVDQTKDMVTIQRVYDQLQTIAMENGIVIITSDHCRKLGITNHDPIDDIINTTSKTAIADAVLALYKTHSKVEANLMGRGRDFEDIDLLIKWDPTTCSWQSLGNAEEAITSQNDAAVLQASKDLIENGELATGKAITGMTDLPRTSVERALKNLISKNLINRGDKVGRQQPYIVVQC